MEDEPAPEAVLRPSLTVGVLSAISTALVVGAGATLVLAPVALALELPVVLVGVGVLVGSLRALVRTHTVE